MPGLCGFVHNGDAGVKTLEPVVQNLQQHVSHFPDALFSDPFLSASLVHRRSGNLGGTWQSPDGTQIWLDGEAFGPNGPMTTEELAERLMMTPTPRLDGAFVALLYQPRLRKLRFLSDPYGLRFLYVRVEGGAPAWSEALTGFMQMPGVKPKINTECLQQILEYGYPLGNTTGFQGVELLPPGACWEYDGTIKSWSRTRYTQIETQVSTPTARAWNNCVAEVAGLFKAAVVKRSSDFLHPGLTLSGGLDSRAILAAMPHRSKPLSAFTFGQVGCSDFALARVACGVAGAKHHTTILGEEGWLQQRAVHVPLTDGHFNILHMHGMESFSTLESLMEVCLNGFLGDALLGGSYLSGPGFPFLQRYLHRGRRFILQALHHQGTCLHFRLPFMDLNLLDTALQLPQSWLINSKIYRSMLLQAFPAYFETIPWEKTGLPISASPLREKLANVQSRLVNKGRKWCGLQARGYTDYAAWLRKGSAADFLESEIGSDQSLLNQRLPEVKSRERLQQHRNGVDHAEILGRHLTLEIWLKHLKNMN